MQDLSFFRSMIQADVAKEGLMGTSMVRSGLVLELINELEELRAIRAIRDRRAARLKENHMRKKLDY